MTRPRFSIPRALAAILALLLAGSVWTGPVAEAQPVTQLTILSATDTDAFMPLIEGFAKERPDIAVSYREYNTNELFDYVMAHHDDADFQGDIVVSSSMDLQVKLVNAGLAQAFTLPSESRVPDWARWRDELYGFTYEPVVVIYNRAAFKDRPLPANHSDLASLIRDNPDFYNGRIATYDVRLSGVGYMFATQDEIQGPHAARLVESFGRAKPHLYCCSYLMLDGVAAGDLVLAYNVIGSYALEAAARDPRIGVHFLNDYTLVMTRSAFVMKRSTHTEEAIAFMTYLLSPEGQRAIARESALIPLSPVARHQAPALETLRDGRRAIFPIRLGTGLLAYLDTMKKRAFLNNWEASLRAPPP